MCSSTATGNLSSLLARVAAGELSASSAASQLSPLLVSGGAQAEDVGGFAKIDHDRSRRTGFPEVVFGEGKSAEQIVDILGVMIKEDQDGRSKAGVAVSGGAVSKKTAGQGTVSFPSSPIVATRVSPEKWSVISAAGIAGLRYHPCARIVYFGGPPLDTENNEAASTSGEAARCAANSIGKVAVLSAGTSDLWVAEEAAVLAELSGAEVGLLHVLDVLDVHGTIRVESSTGTHGWCVMRDHFCRNGGLPDNLTLGVAKR